MDDGDFGITPPSLGGSFDLANPQPGYTMLEHFPFELTREEIPA
jgi:hypothetical protein